MSFSEETFKIEALEAALEWMFFRLVATSKDARAVIADFNSHMDEREKMLRGIWKDKLLENFELASNAGSAADAVKELKDSLMASVKIGG